MCVIVTVHVVLSELKEQLIGKDTDRQVYNTQLKWRKQAKQVFASYHAEDTPSPIAVTTITRCDVCQSACLIARVKHGITHSVRSA